MLTYVILPLLAFLCVLYGVELGQPAPVQDLGPLPAKGPRLAWFVDPDQGGKP